MNKVTSIVVFACGLSMTNVDAAESVCFGTVSNGRLERGVKLPSAGKNFTSYSTLATSVGRTYVHSRVAEIVLTAYQALAQSAPNKVFVYGETGWANGGQIKPHRTHNNGLSVDFMVPVLDASGVSVPLTTGLSNKFGYDLEFDTEGKTVDYTIDFESIAEHLYQLHIASKAQGADIARVIFDLPYLPKLYATKRGAYLRSQLKFMQGRVWIRHDEHYHVDFSVPCKPM